MIIIIITSSARITNEITLACFLKKQVVLPVLAFRFFQPLNYNPYDKAYFEFPTHWVSRQKLISIVCLRSSVTHFSKPTRLKKCLHESNGFVQYEVSINFYSQPAPNMKTKKKRNI